jgi:hypothetical protein
VAEAELERAAPPRVCPDTLASPLAVRSSGIGGRDTMSGEVRPLLLARSIEMQSDLMPCAQ